MAKTILGIDIGYDNLKLALVSGREVKTTISVPMPKNMVRDGRAVSAESMGELIRNTMKDYGIRANMAAYVLPNETVYVKTVSMPAMTADQLVYNLPFEFRDYITGEIRDYLFDYAMISEPEWEDLDRSSETKEGEGGEEEREGRGRMELLAVSAPKADIEEARLILRKAGLKLVKAAPALCCYMGLIRMEMGMDPTGSPSGSGRKGMSAKKKKRDKNKNRKKGGLFSRPRGGGKGGEGEEAASGDAALSAEQERENDQAELPEEEYCILDLGYQAIRLYIFRGDRHMVTRVLDVGLSSLDEVLAEAYSVDIHLAHTYLMTNFEDCRERDECHNAYDNIAMELMRVMNFYRYSNPDSDIREICPCGGGAAITPLLESISTTLDLPLRPVAGLVPGGDGIEDCYSFVQAIGITFQ